MPSRAAALAEPEFSSLIRELGSEPFPASAAALQRLFQHGHRRGDTDAGGDQRQRLVAVLEDEVAGRRENLQLGADLHLVVQVVGDAAARLALDADAQLAAVRRGG